MWKRLVTNYQNIQSIWYELRGLTFNNPALPSYFSQLHGCHKLVGALLFKRSEVPTAYMSWILCPSQAPSNGFAPCRASSADAFVVLQATLFSTFLLVFWVLLPHSRQVDEARMDPFPSLLSRAACCLWELGCCCQPLPDVAASSQADIMSLPNWKTKWNFQAVCSFYDALVCFSLFLSFFVF